MNAERLLKHFDRISEEPDAVPRLRQLILDLAVRGKLVEQDPDDEPVGLLISGISGERKRRAISPEGRVVTEDGAHGRFSVPQTWTWVRLGFLVNVIMGQSPPGDTYNERGDGIPLINGPVEFSPDPFGMTEINQYTTAPTKLCRQGDFLLCVRGSTTGRTNIAGFDACIGRGVAALQPLYDDRFVRLFVWSWRERILNMGRGIAFPSVSRQQIEDLPVPLPPLAEQHRIVARVEELMSLCDELEAAEAERERWRDRVVTATLHSLSNGDAKAAEDGCPTSCEGARFFFSHFSRLISRPEHLKQMRQTILDLAVEGRLLPQCVDDEPASGLLERILHAKRRLFGHRQGKDFIQRCDLSRGDFPHPIPGAWVWTTLGDITDIGTGSTPSRTTTEFWQNGVIPWVTSGLTSQSLISATEESITPSAVTQCRLRIYKPGALVIALYGQGKTRGQVATLGIEATVNQACAVVSPISGFESIQDYLKLVLQKNYHEVRALAAGGTQPNLNVQKVKELFVPLPPLAEQQRIVAKVEELMTVCDELESRLIDQATTQKQLLQALIHESLVG